MKPGRSRRSTSASADASGKRRRMTNVRKALFAFGMIVLLEHSASAAEDVVTAAADVVTAAARKNFSEYLELLAIPNIPDKPDDMRRNAAFLEKAFRKRGFSARLLDNPAGRPLVFAQSDAGAPSARTILFYIHFDGQPVIPEQWAQKSPFQPVIKKRDADGRWREIDRKELLAEPYKAELRVFARSCSRDRPPLELL